MSWIPLGKFVLVRLHKRGSDLVLGDEVAYNGLADVIAVGREVEQEVSVGDVVILEWPAGAHRPQGAGGGCRARGRAARARAAGGGGIVTITRQPRMILSTEGLTSAGKTYFALKGVPRPVLLLDFDYGAEGLPADVLDGVDIRQYDLLAGTFKGESRRGPRPDHQDGDGAVVPLKK